MSDALKIEEIVMLGDRHEFVRVTAENIALAAEWCGLRVEEGLTGPILTSKWNWSPVVEVGDVIVHYPNDKWASVKHWEWLGMTKS